MVWDRLTGLKWAKHADLTEFPLTWAEAAGFVDGLNRDRARDADQWRLPSRAELFSLVSHEHINPALPAGHPFTGVFNGYYWTGTPCARLPAQAWYVHLGGGRVFKGMTHGSYMVWPVCGPRFEPPTNGNRLSAAPSTVLDRATGLVWHKGNTPVAGPVSWTAAFQSVHVLNDSRTGGRWDWRLPNIRELESLIDARFHSPAIQPDHPFGEVEEGYWSSTTSAYDPAYAWVLYPKDGAVGVGYKEKPEFCVWGVAGGQN